MNYISIAMIALTAVTIVLGTLLGLMRGWKRSLLRLGLVLLSVVLAFALCGTVTKGILDMNIANFIPNAGAETLTVADYVTQSLTGGLGLPEGITNLALVLAQSLVKVIMFLLLFGLFQFLTWAIVFPICKIFVKPRKYTNRHGKTVKKKGRLLGAGIGLVQGGVVCVCVCVVLTGILVQANNILTMVNDLESLTADLGVMPQSYDDNGYAIIEDGDSDPDFDPDYKPDYNDEVMDDLDDGEGNGDVERVPDDNSTGGEQPNDPAVGAGEFGAYMDMISEYVESPLGKMYDKISAKWFDKLSEVENANGDKVTLSGQLDAIRGVVDLAKELVRFKDIDFNHLLQSGNVENLKDIFNALQHVNESLSKEAKETIKNALASVAEEMNLPIDLSGLDFDEVDFSKEGEIFTELLDYNDKGEITPEDAKDIVEKIAESDFVLELLADQDNINLSQQLEQGPHRDAIEESIKEMEEKGEIGQGKIDALKKIFGIGSGNNSNTDSGDNSGAETPNVEVEEGV